MANKKKKAGSHISKLKQQFAADLNASIVLALEAPSRTVHATVPPISNSNPSPPPVPFSELPKSNPHVPSASHGFQPQLHVDPSPSINHVFVDSDDDALDDEEVDYASSGDDCARGSQFFTSSVFEAPSVPAASLIGAHSVPVNSPACPFPDPVASPVVSPACPLPDPVASPVPASSTPIAPAEVDVPLAATAPPPPPSASSGRNWCDLFSSGRPPSLCTKLCNFPLNHLTKSCAISPEDFQSQFKVWNLCVVGYVSGKNPGYRALNGIISSVWKCEASLTIHASGWLIYKFTREEDKISVLRGGPYLVYGKPLILKPMTKFFDFSSEKMTRVPVWVRFPNLPFCCWSLCASPKLQVL